MTPTLSIIVAFRGDGHRARVWDFVHERMRAELPEAEIVVGTDDGVDPFHKTLALNRAARAATGDIFAIWDADVWCSPTAVHEAVRLVEAGAAWVKPWHRKLKIDEEATQRALALGAAWSGERIHGDNLEPFAPANHYWSAPPLLVARHAFFGCGGQDERIRGWGGDDDQLAWALKAFYGPLKILKGNAVHLWHPRVDRSGHDRWVGQEEFGGNLGLVRRYQEAWRDPQKMRELIATREAS